MNPIWLPFESLSGAQWLGPKLSSPFELVGRKSVLNDGLPSRQLHRKSASKSAVLAVGQKGVDSTKLLRGKLRQNELQQIEMFEGWCQCLKLILS